jgi:D-lactate dehydrogenase (cytochrome)
MKVPQPAAIDSAMSDLRALLGARATDSAAVREQHGHDESYHTPSNPDIVCFPSTTEEVSGIMRVSAAHGLPVIPFGAGTSLEGHVNAIRGGISISLRQMNRILRVSAEDMDATVEAGVTRLQLNKGLRNLGVTFTVDPGADATIGGMAATRASGTTAVRYGTMRDVVLGLTVVLPDGAVIRTGTRARKSASGYDLTRLFVGSEGTLGVMTELTVRLFPLPEAVSAAVCPFDSLQGAVETVIATIQLGIPVARLEILDEVQMDAVNRFSKTSYPVAPTLFFEFHSDSERHVADQAQAVQALAAERGGRNFQWATRLEDREKLWRARHDTLYAALALRPGCRAQITDVCVPISRLAECILDTRKDNESAPFPIALVGHAGDGNFHLLYILDVTSRVELEAAHRLNERLVERALRLGGTCSGEHGVGTGKMKYLQAEHGAALELMTTLKRAIDPENRMNPGKLIDVEDAEGNGGRGERAKQGKQKEQA